MVGISNIYIDSVLTKLNLKHWHGIYSIDTIPSTLFDNNFTIITNLAPHDAPGTHFVALCQIKEGKNSTLYLFDSLTTCLLYTSPSPRDKRQSRMPSSA